MLYKVNQIAVFISEFVDVLVTASAFSSTIFFVHC